MNKSTVRGRVSRSQVRLGVKLLVSVSMTIAGFYFGEWVLSAVGSIIAVACGVEAYRDREQKREIAPSQP